MNILDYIETFGHLTFAEKELNEIDSLLFSILSYENFDKLSINEKTIEETSKLFFAVHDEKDLNNRVSLTKRSYEVLKAMANSKRFKNLQLNHYVNEVDENQNLQFAALTIESSKWKYVAFRGTDATIVGWKEDFLMCCSEYVLSQEKAADYLNRLFDADSFMNKYIKRSKIYVGGHSKGGNLAMYGAAFCKDSMKKRIVRVDNFDGPGFSDELWQKKQLKKIVSRIHTYIPSSSIFGRLFMHQEINHVVFSDEIGLLQHDAFSWHVEYEHFVYEKKVNEGSENAITKLNEMLLKYNHSQRKEIIEKIFSLIYELNIHTLGDIKKMNLMTRLQVIQKFHELAVDEKKILLEIVKIMIELAYRDIESSGKLFG